MTALPELHTSAGASGVVRRRGLTVLAASGAAVVVWSALTAAGLDLVVEPGTTSAQTVGLAPVIITSLGAGLVAWAVLTLLERYAGARATRVWQVGAGLVLLVSLFPVLAPGSTTTATRASLAVLHVLVAAVVVVGMARPVRSH